MFPIIDSFLSETVKETLKKRDTFGHPVECFSDSDHERHVAEKFRTDQHFFSRFDNHHDDEWRKMMGARPTDEYSENDAYDFNRDEISLYGARAGHRRGE